MVDTSTDNDLVLNVSEFEMLNEIHLVVYCNSPGDQNSGYGELKHHQYAADEPAPASGSNFT